MAQSRMKMATTSETSMMKTDTAAFVTFRVAGDKLDPAQVTALLGLPPTHAYAKGAHYQRGGRAQVARTGVWYFSTDGVVDSSSLEDHAIYLLKFSALGSNIQKLRNLIE